MHTKYFSGKVARRCGVQRDVVYQVLSAFIDEAVSLLREGDEVRLPGFGVFHVVWAWGAYRVRFSPYPTFREHFSRSLMETTGASGTPQVLHGQPTQMRASG